VLERGTEIRGSGSPRINFEVFFEFQTEERVEDRFFYHGLFRAAKGFQPIHGDARVIVQPDQDCLSECEGCRFLIRGTEKLKGISGWRGRVRSPLIDKKTKGIGRFSVVAWSQRSIGAIRREKRSEK
jgi:hypothetical protein